MNTSLGAIELEFFDEDAPETVANFRKLAGDHFYDGIIFHRVIPDFMIQGGCPEGTGTGGPGYTFADEFNQNKVVRGALAMANAGPNTNGSQFFIVTAGACEWLDGKHTVFGAVSDGMQVVDRLEAVETDAADRPVAAVAIESMPIVRVGRSDASVGTRSRLSTTSWPSRTRPNTVCLPSSHGHARAVTMKNCDPLVSGPAFAIASAPCTTLCELISSGNV